MRMALVNTTTAMSSTIFVAWRWAAVQSALNCSARRFERYNAASATEIARTVGRKSSRAEMRIPATAVDTPAPNTDATASANAPSMTLMRSESSRSRSRFGAICQVMS
jgi:hypothetical protein